MAGYSDSDTDGDVSEDCFDYDGGPLSSAWILKLFPDCAYVTASFDFLQNGNSTEFTSTSVNATEWFWDFGDGTTDTTENPVHTYSSPGSYTVCLTASDSCSINTLCETITILSTTSNEPGRNDVSLDIHPNPFHSNTIISFALRQSERIKIQLFDLHGRWIKTISEETYPAGHHEVILDADALPAQVYHVQFETTSGIQSQKLAVRSR